jgi:hypothetical protein
VVAIDGHVSGVVSAGDVARAVELAPFRPHPIVTATQSCRY